MKSIDPPQCPVKYWPQHCDKYMVLYSFIPVDDLRLAIICIVSVEALVVEFMMTNDSEPDLGCGLLTVVD